MSPYEPWRALRNLEVPDGARERLLAGIERRRSRSGRRAMATATLVGAVGVAAIWLVVARSPAARVDTGSAQGADPGSARTGEVTAATSGVSVTALSTTADATSPSPSPSPSPSSTATPSSTASPPARRRSPAEREPAADSDLSRAAFAGSQQRDGVTIERDDLEVDGPADTLAEEVRAFRAARRLSGEAALRALRAHRARWPDSALRPEVDRAIARLEARP